jgi:hypothetical protein
MKSAGATVVGGRGKTLMIDGDAIVRATTKLGSRR